MHEIHRAVAPGRAIEYPTPVQPQPTRIKSAVVTPLAVALAWFALTVPSKLVDLTPSAIIRLPLEAVGFLTLVVAIPRRMKRTRTAVALGAGALLGVLSILRLLDIGFHEALGRPFHAVVDWGNLASGAGLLVDAVGWPLAAGLMAVAIVLAVALLAFMPPAVLRITRVSFHHRRGALRLMIVLFATWLALTVADVQIGDSRVASIKVAPYAYEELSSIPAGVRDQREFAQAAANDPLDSTPTDQLLTALRGKDVLFVFVESYGRVALEDPELSAGIGALLDAEDERLRADGFSSQSAFLTAPTFGGISWLAHSTFQSGLWVDSKQRYDVLMASDRLTLSHAFNRVGWRTVVDVPANTADWPRRTFYDYDQLYDSRNVGYKGPRFGYPTIPDQYTLDAFHALELSAADRQPVMAEIDLVSSHAPWAPVPRLVEQELIGDGSIYEDMPRSPAPSGPEGTRKAYAESIEYSLGSVFSFLESHGDDNTVLVFMGDHQPATTISGPDSGNDVPVTIIAKDPNVFDRISSWRWESGMTPSPGAPVVPMDEFRDKFLDAFSS